MPIRRKSTDHQLGKLRLYLAVDDPDDAEGDPIPIGHEKAKVPQRVVEAANAAECVQPVEGG